MIHMKSEISSLIVQQKTKIVPYVKLWRFSMFTYKAIRDLCSKYDVNMSSSRYKTESFIETKKYGVYKRKKIYTDYGVLTLFYKWKIVFEADSNADINFQKFWYYDKELDILVSLKQFNKPQEKISINFPYNLKITCYTFLEDNLKNMHDHSNELIEKLTLILTDKFSIVLKSVQQVEIYNPINNHSVYSAQRTLYNKQTKRVIDDTYNTYIKGLMDNANYKTLSDQNQSLRAYTEILESENIVGNYLTLYGMMQDNVPKPTGSYKAQKYVDAFIRRVYAILSNDPSFIQYEKNYDSRFNNNGSSNSFQMNDDSFVKWVNELIDSELKVGNNLFEINEKGCFSAAHDQFKVKMWLEKIIGYQLRTLDDEDLRKLIEVETSLKNKNYHETIYSSVRNEIGHFSNDVEYCSVLKSVDKYYYGLVILVKLVL